MGLLLCALGACSSDIDALYAAPKARDGGTGQTAVPLLPALPDEGVREACRACATSECKDARASCLDDDACSAMLRSKGTCSDPACLERCDVENDRSAWYRDYSSCVFETACAADCAQGQSFACLERYEVHAGEESSYVVTWHFTSNSAPDDPARSTSLSPTLGGATVKACNTTSSDCDAVGGSQGTTGVDGYSRAKMTLEGTPFRGYLELAGGPFDEQALLYEQPVSGREWREVGMASRYLLLGAGPTVGVDFNSPQSLLRASDCLLEAAPGVHFLLDDQAIDPIAYQRVDSTWGAQGPTSATGIALATVDLDDQSVRQAVVEARNENDDVLSRRSIFLRDGWSTQIQMMPREHGEP